VRVASDVAAAQIAGLVQDVETNDAGLRARYQGTHDRVGKFFDGWFALSAAKSSRRSAKGAATDGGNGAASVNEPI
jgi:hypothetical protein